MDLKNRVEDYVQALVQSPVLSQRIAWHRTLPAVLPDWAAPQANPEPMMDSVLVGAGIDRLYRHQAQAINRIRAGLHTVVATPTASGKTLIYSLPVLERLIRDPDSRALFIFPLKALAQDQLRSFETLSSAVHAMTPAAAIYDGDTSAWLRRKIRQRPPHVLLTNPEMIHLSLLPHHQRWATFLSQLAIVVVDEVHTYRGIMGSHMSQVFRRLRRICRCYGTDPTFVFASATVANPSQLCQQLTGLHVQEIIRSGAPRGRRHLLFLDPGPTGTARTAILLLKAALARQLRTIVYSKSRKYTELIAIWAKQEAGRFAERISAYRAGFLAAERRSIEARLASGELLAVITTSALELGIDIGDLDLCILVGYPGSIVATWQRAGRVGRSGQDSAMIMVAGEDALDQYFLRHPDDFLKRTPEAAMLNPQNPQIQAAHLECAAAELPLAIEDPLLADPGARNVLEDLEASGRLLRSADGRTLYARRKQPQRTIDLRGAGKRYQIVTLADQRLIGEIDAFRAFRETHPGAIYLHQGHTYRVEGLDPAGQLVSVTPVSSTYHTRIRAQGEIQIQNAMQSKKTCGIDCYAGILEVTDKVTGYDVIQTRTGQVLHRMDLDLPPQVFSTEGCWFVISEAIQRAVNHPPFDYLGGLHALEHAAIGILPLLVMADRNDLGGISTAYHHQTGGAAIFIYDAVPGGAGISRQAFECARELLQNTLAVIESCPCPSGCPSCVHSPKCGSGNRPIDKAAALRMLREIVQGTEAGDSTATLTMPAKPGMTAVRRPRMKDDARFGVLDVETQLSAEEVGGWRHVDQMKISCAVLYDSQAKDFFEFVEGQVPLLIERLQSLDRVVGFNIKRFDFMVLSRYTGYEFSRLPTLDILEEVKNRLGFRLSLDHLCGATLGEHKSGDGLAALQWWKEGKMRKILDYCRSDVRLTRDLFLYGRENGYLLFNTKDHQKRRVNVDW